MAILGAVQQLSDYLIIWRFQSDFAEADTQPNIMRVQWMPQATLLSWSGTVESNAPSFDGNI